MDERAQQSILVASLTRFPLVQHLNGVGSESMIFTACFMNSMLHQASLARCIGAMIGIAQSGWWESNVCRYVRGNFSILPVTIHHQQGNFICRSSKNQADYVFSSLLM